MARRALLLGLAGLLCASVPAQGASRQPNLGEPTDAITADLGFVRAVRAKGLFAAMRETAADEAQVVWIGPGGPHPLIPLALRGASEAQPGLGMPLPQPQRVADFIKSHAAPATTPAWHVTSAWMSCDGSAAVSAGKHGDNAYFTVWKRQKHGDYKWVLLVEGQSAAAASGDNQDMIVARLADCPARTRTAQSAPPPLAPAATGTSANSFSGTSSDGTLRWNAPPNSLYLQPFTLEMKLGGAMQSALQDVLTDGIPHPAPVANR